MLFALKILRGRGGFVLGLLVLVGIPWWLSAVSAFCFTHGGVCCGLGGGGD